VTRFIAALVAGALVAGGCQTMTGRSAGQWVDDRAVTARVKARLAWMGVARLTRVHVDTYEGIVYLTGGVDSAEQKRRAEEVTRDVPSVRLVVNNLHVVVDDAVGGASPRTDAGRAAPARTSSAPPIEELARLDVETGTPVWTRYAGYDAQGRRVATVVAVATDHLVQHGVPEVPVQGEVDRIDLRPDPAGGRAFLVLWHRAPSAPARIGTDRTGAPR
jgi:hyperosmotically inducible protein